MRLGTGSTAFCATIIYSSIYFYAGLPLKPLLEDCQKMTSTLLDFRQMPFALMVLPFEQCASNLLCGTSLEDILTLDQGRVREVRSDLGWNGGSGEFTELALRMQLAFYCEEYGLAMTLMEKVKKFGEGTSRNMWPDQARTLFCCLIELRAAESSWNVFARRAHHRRAQAYCDLMREWVREKGSINSAHRLLILEAEMEAFASRRRKRSRSWDGIKGRYDEAISAASRSGFLQDAALAAHMASRTLPKQDAVAYWQRAMTLYKKWGAEGLVNHLERTKSLESSTRGKQEQEVVADSHRSGIRGRSRFDTSLARFHRSSSSWSDSGRLSTGMVSCDSTASAPE